MLVFPQVEQVLADTVRLNDYEGKMVPYNITADYENLQPAVSAKAEVVAEVIPPQSK